jgi:hypothetical protein
MESPATETSEPTLSSDATETELPILPTPVTENDPAILVSDETDKLLRRLHAPSIVEQPAKFDLPITDILEHPTIPADTEIMLPILDEPDTE